jgi:hypothetical protein
MPMGHFSNQSIDDLSRTQTIHRNNKGANMINFSKNPADGGDQVSIDFSKSEINVTSCTLTISGSANGTSRGGSSASITVTTQKDGGTLYARVDYVADPSGPGTEDGHIPVRPATNDA